MSQTMFRITGRIIDQHYRQGIPGLRVEAWDKDLLLIDLVVVTSVMSRVLQNSIIHGFTCSIGVRDRPAIDHGPQWSANRELLSMDQLQGRISLTSI